MTLKTIVLGIMSLYTVYKHDSVADISDNSTSFNGTIYIGYDDNMELSKLRATLENAEAKYDKYCTAPASDCSECHHIRNEIREAASIYATRAHQKAANQEPKNLISNTENIKERFNKNCNTSLRKDGIQDGVAHPDSIVGYNDFECSEMQFAISGMQEQLKKFNQRF